MATRTTGQQPEFLSRDPAEIFAHAEPTMIRAINRMVGHWAGEDLKDLHQEARLRLVQGIKSWQDKQPKPKMNWRGYATIIARNLVVDYTRKEKRAVRPDELPDQIPDQHPDFARAHDAFWEAAASGINDPGRRKIFLLHHRHGLKEREIAALTGIPQGTVKSRLHRARNELAGNAEAAEELTFLAAEIARLHGGMTHEKEMK